MLHNRQALGRDIHEHFSQHRPYLRDFQKKCTVIVPKYLLLPGVSLKP